jgi:hypothetical protein
MTDTDWNDPGGSLLIAVFTIPDSRVAIVVNRGRDGRSFSLPSARDGRCWRDVYGEVDADVSGRTVRARCVRLFAEAGAAASSE